MKIQVIAQRKKVLNADLLDSFVDDNYISVADCLVYLKEPPSFSAPEKSLSQSTWVLN